MLKPICLIFVICFISLSTIKCDDHTLEISGSAEVSIPNELIVIGFSIETKENDSKDSFSKNNNIALKVHDLLVNQLGIPEKNITTTSFEMYNSYIQLQNKTENLTVYYNKYDGFVVRNSLEVKLSNKSIAADLVSTLIKQGVEKINYLYFIPDSAKEKEIRKNLLSEAASDAFNKANLIVQSLGVSIVDVKSISQASFYYPLRRARESHTAARFASATDMSTPLYSGEDKSTVNLNVVFIIRKLKNNNTVNNSLR